MSDQNEMQLRINSLGVEIDNLADKVNRLLDESEGEFEKLKNLELGDPAYHVAVEQVFIFRARYKEILQIRKEKIITRELLKMELARSIDQ